MTTLMSKVAPALAYAGLIILSGSTKAFSPSGYSNAGPGPVQISVLGNTFPCTMTLTAFVSPTGGATVVNAGFLMLSSPLCPYFTANNLPWTFTTPFPTLPNTYTFTINGVDISLKQANGTVFARCTGSLSATLDQSSPFVPHALTFSGPLTTVAPIAGQACIMSARTGGYLGTSLTAP